MLLDMIANSVIFACLVTHTRITCVGKESWACMKVFSRQNATIFAGGKEGQGPSIVIFVLQEGVRSEWSINKQELLKTRSTSTFEKVSDRLWGRL